MYRFGHKAGYRDLLRVYMLKRSRQIFQDFAAASAALRRAIKEHVILKPGIDGSLRRLFSLQQQHAAEGLTAQIQQYLELTSPSRMRDAKQSKSLHFLRPALDETNACRNYTALLQLQLQLQQHRMQNGRLGTALGEYEDLAQVYHLVPWSGVMEFLAGLVDFSGSQQAGQRLAMSLRHSGCKQPQLVNVVLCGYKPHERQHGGIRCSVAPEVQFADDQSDSLESSMATTSTVDSELALGQRGAQENSDAPRIRRATGSAYTVQGRAIESIDFGQLGQLYAEHVGHWKAAAMAVPGVGANGVAAASRAAESGLAALSGDQALLPVHASLLRLNRNPVATPPFTAFQHPKISRHRPTGLKDLMLDAVVIEREGGGLQLAEPSQGWYNLGRADVGDDSDGDQPSNSSESEQHITAEERPTDSQQPGSDSGDSLTRARSIEQPPMDFQVKQDDKYRILSRTCRAPPAVIIYVADPLYAGMYTHQDRAGTPNSTGGTESQAAQKRLWFDKVYSRTAASEARAAAYPVPLVVLELPKFGGMRQLQAGTLGYPEDIAELLPATQEQVRDLPRRVAPFQQHCLQGLHFAAHLC